MYQFKEKLDEIDHLSQVTAQLNEQVAELKAQMQTVSAEAKRYQDKIDAIKSDIKIEMENDGCLEHKQDGCVFKLHKKPQSLDIVCNPEELPDEYQRIKVEADKAKLKKDFKDGLATNYCRLSEPEYKLVIEHG